jgi:hypothetical protein
LTEFAKNIVQLINCVVVFVLAIPIALSIAVFKLAVDLERSTLEWVGNGRTFRQSTRDDNES